MPKNPPILRLDLEQSQPGSSQIEAWRENVAPLWEVTPDEENTGRFRAGSEVHHLGSAILGLTKVSGHQIRRSPLLIARMGVDHVLIQFRKIGTYRAEADGRALETAPGDICLFDMTRPLVGWSSDYEGITLALPRALIASFLSDIDTVHGTVIRGTTPLGRLAADHLCAISRNAARFSPEDAIAAMKGTAALLAACAENQSVLPEAARTVTDPAILLTLRQYIEANLSNSHLTVDHLAIRFGLSRSGLYRSFESLGGVAGYIRRRRLASAYRELANVENPHLARIQDVARRWAFGSATNFDHAFKREFGITPRDVRKEELAGRSTAVNLSKAQAGTGLYDWVLDLSA